MILNINNYLFNKKTFGFVFTDKNTIETTMYITINAIFKLGNGKILYLEREFQNILIKNSHPIL